MSRVVRYVRNGSVEDAPATGVGRSSDVKLTGKVVYDFQRDPPFDEARTLDRIRTWIRHVDSATAAEARMKNDSELSD